MKKPVRITRTIIATNLLVAIAVGLTLPVSLPTNVQAATNPVDLELGGEGATPWSIGDIKPGDNGTKTVTLRNTGSRDGFVTIWLSDIVGTDGTSPEFATGNTTEPGDLIDSLWLGLSGNGTGTNLSLPTTINNFPRSALDSKYIEVIPLKVGDTVNLDWQWVLPAQTGNKAQGDSISFTINYLLRESQIADVSSVVTSAGVFTENVTANCTSGIGAVTIEKDTVGQTEAGDPLSEMWIIDIDKEPITSSSGRTTMGYQYDVGPHGATFDRPVALTLAYDPAGIPAGARAQDLVVARLDENTNNWIELEGSNVDTTSNTISVSVSHFSRYAIVAPAPIPLPQPPAGGPPAMGQRIGGLPPRAILETDISGEKQKVEIRADGTLIKPLKLTSPDGRFVIDVDGGSKIASRDGMPITRLELSLVKELVPLPPEIVMLSSVYKVTGYVGEQETSQITFSSPARITILYDPKSLPENVFPPFVAYYTLERGLEPLESPLGAVVDIGKAKAEISHASLFFAAAKLVPPPPPLPPKFEVGNLVINPPLGRVGQSVVITVKVANDGEIAGSYQLQLKVDGIVRAVKEITIAAKSSEKVNFEIRNLPVGRHDVEIAGLNGSFRIISTAVLPIGPAVDWFMIDLSIGGLLFAGLLTLYLLRRRL